MKSVCHSKYCAYHCHWHMKEVYLTNSGSHHLCIPESTELSNTYLTFSVPSVPQSVPQHVPWTSFRLDHLNLHTRFSRGDEGRTHPERLVGFLPCHQHESAIALVVEYDACNVVIHSSINKQSAVELDTGEYIFPNQHSWVRILHLHNLCALCACACGKEGGRGKEGREGGEGERRSIWNWTAAAEWFWTELTDKNNVGLSRFVDQLEQDVPCHQGFLATYDISRHAVRYSFLYTCIHVG